MPKISVIAPIYNAEKYLYECLDSIRQQTLTDIEVICVDDGSTDDSPRIMDEFAEKDSRFKVIRKTNSGYGNSVNRGIEAATGDYIGIVESDDYIVKEMYEELYAMTEDGTVDVVKGNFWDCYDEADGSITKVENHERIRMPDVEESFKVREHLDILWGHPSIWSGIYRRQFLIDNGIRFEEVKGGGWVDNPFFFETLFCAEKIRWTSKPYYCYRKTNETSSSTGYDLSIPFERMRDNLSVAETHNYNDENVLKFLYARAFMYLVGATQEEHYAWNEDSVRPLMRQLLKQMDEDVITDDFNIWDQRTFYKYRSPMSTLMPKTAKILIYNWLPFDNSNHAGGGVTIYCRNLIAALLRYRPDVQVYFISSGWAYEVSTPKCYFRKIDNVLGERCRSFEIVNSPVPAPQDMLFYNPEIAFESEELKEVFLDFIQKNGPFDVVHFQNMEGLSLDVFDIKKELPDTKFIYSLHNYVPICMTGFYFRRDLQCNCTPYHTAADCGRCIDRDDNRKLRTEMVNRAKVNVPDADSYNDDRWAVKFGFEKLDIVQDEAVVYEFAERAKKAINDNMDVVLAVSDRVRILAEQNGIRSDLLRTSYIGTRIANFQVGRSTAIPRECFTIAYLGTQIDWVEKGYHFLIDALEQMDPDCASQINLILTTTTFDRDEYLQDKLQHFHSLEIIHGYTHSDLPYILQNAELGIVPVLWEDNLPQVAIEMVALGVPILCSDAGGSTELCDSEMFRFKAGDKEDFIKKLSYLAGHREKVNDYWKTHNGLVTMEKHCSELSKIYGLPRVKTAKISVTDYADLLAENDFLYQHFKAEQNSVSIEEFNRVAEHEGDLQAEINQLSEREGDLQAEINQLSEQRDYLQYVIDETRKSKSYKLSLALTAPVRRIRDRNTRND